MLVLSRFPDEKIVIGGGITITVIGVRSDGKVRIGIDAPRDIAVNREEVQQRIDNKRLESNVERQQFNQCPPGKSLGRMSVDEANSRLQ